jgi:hypothetical protein
MGAKITDLTRPLTPTVSTQLTLGCRMLHYTGIGKPSCLIFEKEKPVGETNVLVRAQMRVPCLLLSNHLSLAPFFKYE